MSITESPEAPEAPESDTWAIAGLPMMALHKLPVHPTGKASCYEFNSFLRTYCLGQEPKTLLTRQALAPVVHQATTVGRRQAIKHPQQIPSRLFSRAHLQARFGKWLAQRRIDRARMQRHANAFPVAARQFNRRGFDQLIQGCL